MATTTSSSSTTTKVQIPLLVSFLGTILCSLMYLPTLLWASSLLRRFIRDQYDCQGLINLPMSQTMGALTLMTVLLLVYVLVLDWYKEKQSSSANIFAAVLLLVFFVVARFGVIQFMEVMEKRTYFGVFGSPPKLTGNNNTEYWKVNMKSCECKTRSCEEVVYREYLADMYSNNDKAYIAWLENKDLVSCKPADYCDQIMKDKSYRDVIYERGMLCYSAYSSEKELENGQCQGCYACEEDFIEKLQRRCWKFGNALYAMSWLLALSFHIVFAAELWDFFLG